MKILSNNTALCKICLSSISIVEEYPDLCNEYCCKCCPDNVKEKCKKEEIFGSPLDFFKNSKNQKK